MTQRIAVVGLLFAVLFGAGSPPMVFAQQPAKPARIGYLSRLPGCADYQKQVRYRLVPFVW